jgi:glycosyltransferase involved in cell wall biosynthesis
MISVAILTNSFSGGGAERSMNLVANALDKLGFDVALIAVNTGPQDFVKLECKTFCLERNKDLGVLGTYKTRRSLKSLLNDLKPKYIIVNCELPELLVASIRTKSRLIIVEHASNPWFGRKLLGSLIRGIIYLRNPALVGVSSAVRSWPLRGKSMEVIENPIDLPKLREIETLSKRLDKPRLVFIGRLHAIKNPRKFLSICKHMGIQGVVIGDGIMKKELIELSKVEKIKIDFLGQVENPWDFVNANDILVLTSHSEGDGLVIVEALARDIPMVIQRGIGLERFPIPDNNFCSSIEEFVGVLSKQLRGEIELKISKEASENLLRERNINIIAKKWQRMLSK